MFIVNSAVKRFRLALLMIAVFMLISGCSYLRGEKYELKRQTKEKKGTIKLSPLGGKYKQGTVVTVRAVPAEDYVFKRWSGDLSGKEQQQTIKVTKDLKVKARFDGKPIFKNLTDKQVTIDQQLKFKVQPQDPEGKKVSVKINNKPLGAKFNSKTGQFSWQPNQDDLGTYQVTFLASDGQLNKRRTVTIEVCKPNKPPQFNKLTDQTVFEGQKLAFKVQAKDPEGKQIKLKLKNKPKEAVFNPQTGQFNWIPDHKAAGKYKINFTASDGELKTTKKIKLTVKNKNQAPVLQKIGDKQVAKDEKLKFQVQAGDPDGEPVTLKVRNKPVGATFDPTTGKFTWKPDYNPVGNYKVTFLASDGKLSMQETITIKVGKSNRPPTAEADTTTTAAGKEVNLNLLTNDSDPDGDQLKITKVTNGTHGGVINNQDGTVTYQPSLGYTGRDSFSYTVADPQGEIDQAQVTIQIKPKEKKINLQAIDDVATGHKNSSLTIDLLANDKSSSQYSLTISQLGSAAHGKVKKSGPGQITYQPNPDYTGQDSFSYQISNGQGATDKAQVKIRVKPPVQRKVPAPRPQ